VLLFLLVMNAAMLGWFARARGWAFAAGVVPLRVTYYTVNACSATWAILQHLRAPSRAGRAPDQRSAATSRAAL